MLKHTSTICFNLYDKRRIGLLKENFFGAKLAFWYTITVLLYLSFAHYIVEWRKLSSTPHRIVHAIPVFDVSSKNSESVYSRVRKNELTMTRSPHPTFPK